MINETIFFWFSLFAFVLGGICGWSTEHQRAEFYYRQSREDRRLARWLIARLATPDDIIDDALDELSAPPVYDADECEAHIDEFESEVLNDDVG